MKGGSGILQLAILAGALICLASAKNRVCFNANSQLLKVFCDDVDYTGMLPNRLNSNKCDCIFMPACKVLAVKAHGVEDGQISHSAVSVCQTADPTPYQNWVCHPAKKQTPLGWHSMSYNHAKWKPAAKLDNQCARSHCHEERLRPCRGSCIWNKYPPAPTVNCVTKQCALDCNTCQQNGPGNCDPGQCKNGVATNVRTNLPVCNHKCALEFQAWDTPTATGAGYLKLRDTVSHSVDKFEATLPGLYLAVIDMNQCAFIYKNYTTWTAKGYNAFLGAGSLLLGWTGDLTGPMTSNVAVHLGVGTGTLYFTATPSSAPSPSFAAYTLGLGIKTYLVIAGTKAPIKGYCNGIVYLTGITNGITTVDSYSVSNPC